MNKNEGENKIEEAKREAPAAPAVADEMATFKAASEGEKKQERSATPRSRRRARYRPTIVIEAAGLFVLCLYTVSSYLQWQALITTNELTRESNETTKQAAAASQRLMAESNELTSQIIVESQRGIAQAKEQTKIAAKGARDAEQSFRHGARARFRIEGFESQRAPSEWTGEVFPVLATVKNVGNSSAVVEVRGEMMIGHPSIEIPDSDILPRVDRVLVVNMGESSNFAVPGIKLEQGNWVGFESGTVKVFAAGWIISHDELEEVHRTFFCAILEPSSVASGAIRTRKLEDGTIIQDREPSEQKWGRCNLNNGEL